jgi:ribosomal protein S18 acetylase RimI-like enzyme
MTIRRIKPYDWEQLREIRVRALEESPDSYGSTISEARRRTAEDWRAWARIGSCSPGTAMFVAVERGRIIGLCCSFLREDEPRIAQIVAMWVDPNRRGRRLAEQLLDAASTWSTASGAIELVLDVTETNRSARKLYSRAGFRETGRMTPLRSKPALLTVEMRKPLPGMRDDMPRMANRAGAASQRDADSTSAVGRWTAPGGRRFESA